jgi:hypothetical protein
MPMKKLRQNKIKKMKYPGLFLFLFALFFSSCSGDEETKMEAFSPEAFAYDLGSGWEVNASTFVKGFKQEKEGEIYTALLSYDLDLVTQGTNRIFNHDRRQNNEEMIDACWKHSLNLIQLMHLENIPWFSGLKTGLLTVLPDRMRVLKLLKNKIL